MKLTSKGRYAVMALVDLARFDNINPVSLRDISLRQGISLDYLEQIFSKLKKNEIVKSIRGTQGGYVLNKNPNDIKTKIFKFLIYIYLLFLFLIPSCLGIKNISRIKRTGIKKVFNMFI